MDQIYDIIRAGNSWLNGIVWGIPALVLLMGAGIFLTLGLKGFQFRKFGYAMKNTIGKMFHKHEARAGEVTPFQALTTALAATVGTGNIAGITSAVTLGGAGSIFWLWISALLGMATKYSEVLLAVKYRERNAHGDWVGGPMYYIKNGLSKNWKWLAVLFACLTVVVANAAQIPHVFGMIFRGAFTPEAVTGGAAGLTIKLCVEWGVKRGVFSNEAGLGSAPIAHAASSESNPVKQGLYGIFEVFMDTIVICTLTGLTLLLTADKIGITYGKDPGTSLNAQALGTVFGSQIGALIIAIGLSLFALSTVLSWGLYGTRCWEYILGTKAIKPYQIIFTLVVLVGATMDLGLAWDIADTLNGLMAIPNLIAIFALSGVVFKTTKEFFQRDTLAK